MLDHGRVVSQMKRLEDIMDDHVSFSALPDNSSFDPALGDDNTPEYWQIFYSRNAKGPSYLVAMIFNENFNDSHYRNKVGTPNESKLAYATVERPEAIGCKIPPYQVDQLKLALKHLTKQQFVPYTDALEGQGTGEQSYLQRLKAFFRLQ